jgi:transposase
LVLDKIRRRFPWLELIWADGGYNAWQVDAAVAKVPLLRTEIVKRSDDVKGFVVLPRRRVVERTFPWFGRNRRLAKDFENLAETLATFVTLASIQLALRRLAGRRRWPSTLLLAASGCRRIGQRTLQARTKSVADAPIPAVTTLRS